MSKRSIYFVLLSCWERHQIWHTKPHFTSQASLLPPWLKPQSSPTEHLPRGSSTVTNTKHTELSAQLHPPVKLFILAVSSWYFFYQSSHHHFARPSPWSLYGHRLFACLCDKFLGQVSKPHGNLIPLYYFELSLYWCWLLHYVVCCTIPLPFYHFSIHFHKVTGISTQVLFFAFLNKLSSPFFSFFFHSHMHILYCLHFSLFLDLSFPPR